MNASIASFPPATYSIAETAALCGVSKSHAYAIARSGVIAGVPVIRVGTRMLVPRKALDRVLSALPSNGGAS